MLLADYCHFYLQVMETVQYLFTSASQKFHRTYELSINSLSYGVTTPYERESETLLETKFHTAALRYVHCIPALAASSHTERNLFKSARL